MMRPPVHPIRVEPILLADLRKAFPDITFSTIRSRTDPPYTECVLSAEPQQLVTSITQSVTLRMSVYVVREDATGDWQTAQSLASDIERHILSTDYAQVVGMEHSSGPLRIAVDDIIIAYSLISMDVLVR